MDKIYLDHINGTIEAFTYAEGRRFLMSYPPGLDLLGIKRFFQRKNFTVVTLKY